MDLGQKIRTLLDQLMAALRQSEPEEMPEAMGELARAKAIIKGRLLLANSGSRGGDSDGPPDPLILIPEVAKILRISEHQARVMHRRGELPTLKVGKRVGMRQSALLQYLERRERNAGH